MSQALLFEYKRNGKDSGFMACTDKDYVFKPDKYSCATIRVETLRKNLRSMIKSKRATLIKAGTVEAVAVPANEFYNLYI